jgi:hypothetical protein
MIARSRFARQSIRAALAFLPKVLRIWPENVESAYLLARTLHVRAPHKSQRRARKSHTTHENCVTARLLA